MSLLFWRDNQQAALVGVHRKVSAVDCHIYGLLEGMMHVKEHRIPQLLPPWRDNGMPGDRAPQEVQPKEVEPGYVCPPHGQGCNALTTVDLLLDATFRVFRDGQGVLLGKVIEGFVALADIDVFLITLCWGPQWQQQTGFSAAWGWDCSPM